jgi:hypothetical protein
VSEECGYTPQPALLTKDNILDHIIACGKILDEQAVPQEDRWLCLWIPKHRQKRIRKKWFNKRYPSFRGIEKNFL